LFDVLLKLLISLREYQTKQMADLSLIAQNQSSKSNDTNNSVNKKHQN
jgi:hypothetical protein